MTVFEAGAAPTAAHHHRRARLRFDPDVLAHFDGAAGEGRTAQANLAAFDAIYLRQRVLPGVATADPAVEILGTTLANPVGVAPVGSYGKVSDEACREVAEGAESAGSLLLVSQAARLRPAEWRSYAGGAMALVGYLGWGREALRGLVAEAEEEGFTAIGVTVDSVVAQQIGWVVPASGDGSARTGHPVAEDDLRWLRDQTSLPIFAKGIMSVHDARVAVDCGADAVVVSNHGGRLLDGGQSTLDVLGPVVDAVGGDAEVIFDGGVRRGSDVVIALALGARLVLVGRPVCWALADGAGGVASLLVHLREDTARAMCLMGAAEVGHLGRSMLAFARESFAGEARA